MDGEAESVLSDAARLFLNSAAAACASVFLFPKSFRILPSSSSSPHSNFPFSGNIVGKRVSVSES